MTDVPQTRIRMTLEEFMALPETKDRYELIDGELFVSPAPKDPHEASNISVILFLGRTTQGGHIRGSSSDLHLGRDVVRPDVFWIAPDNTRCTLGSDNYWHGAPDLVVEILSPSTEERDKDVKFDLYEKHGVHEYWMIDPNLRLVEVHHIENGKFVRQGVFGIGKVFTSKVLNHQVVVNELFA